MADGRLALPLARCFSETTRRDRWWVQPLVVVLGLTTFIVYSTWAAMQGGATITCASARLSLTVLFS